MAGPELVKKYTSSPEVFLTKNTNTTWHPTEINIYLSL
jgi:hypothetical protein